MSMNATKRHRAAERLLEEKKKRRRPTTDEWNRAIDEFMRVMWKRQDQGNPLEKDEESVCQNQIPDR